MPVSFSHWIHGRRHASVGNSVEDTFIYVKEQIDEVMLSRTELGLNGTVMALIAYPSSPPELFRCAVLCAPAKTQTVRDSFLEGRWAQNVKT